MRTAMEGRRKGRCRTRRAFGTVAFVLCALAATTPAMAQQKKPTAIDADAEIAKCWASSTELRTYDAAEPMRIATAETVACLKGFVLARFDAIFPAGDRRNDAKGILAALEDGYGKVNRVIFAAPRRRCAGGCASLEGMDRTRYARVLDGLVADATAIRNRMNGFPSSPPSADVHLTQLTDNHADADKIVDGCLAISKRRRESGNTESVHKGLVSTVNCLEFAVTDRANAYLVPWKSPNKEWVLPGLHEFFKFHAGLVQYIQTDNGLCNPECVPGAPLAGDRRHFVFAKQVLRDAIWMQVKGGSQKNDPPW